MKNHTRSLILLFTLWSGHTFAQSRADLGCLPRIDALFSIGPKVPIGGGELNRYPFEMPAYLPKDPQLLDQLLRSVWHLRLVERRRSIDPVDLLLNEIKEFERLGSLSRLSAIHKGDGTFQFISRKFQNRVLEFHLQPTDFAKPALRLRVVDQGQLSPGRFELLRAEPYIESPYGPSTRMVLDQRQVAQWSRLSDAEKGAYLKGAPTSVIKALMDPLKYAAALDLNSQQVNSMSLDLVMELLMDMRIVTPEWYDLWIRVSLGARNDVKEICLRSIAANRLEVAQKQSEFAKNQFRAKVIQRERPFVMRFDHMSAGQLTITRSTLNSVDETHFRFVTNKGISVETTIDDQGRFVDSKNYLEIDSDLAKLWSELIASLASRK
jgi:hypothetical protein